MTRRAAQLNIRSDEARRRVGELVRETGKSATQVVEDALQAYRPQPAQPRDIPEGLEWNGKFFVIKSRGGPPETLEETNRSIEAMRNRDLFGD